MCECFIKLPTNSSLTALHIDITLLYSTHIQVIYTSIRSLRVKKLFGLDRNKNKFVNEFEQFFSNLYTELQFKVD